MGESRSAEHSVQDSNARYDAPYERPARLFDALLDATPDALWAEDPDGNIIAWNAGAERLFGWPADEIMGRPGRILLPAGYAPVEPIGERRFFDTVRLRRDGTAIDVAIEMSPVRDEGGRRIGVARRASERAGRSRAAFGADLFLRLDRALSDTLDADVIFGALADALVPATVDACIAYVPRRNGSIRRVCARHADPARADAIERILAMPEPALDDPAGPGAALRDGVAILVSDLSRADLESLSGGQRAAMREIDPAAVALVPLRARDRTVGVVAVLMSRRSGRTLSKAALENAQKLCDRAAIALDNARLFHQAQAELARRHLAEEALRQRFEHLGVVYHMTEAVGRADALESIYDEALDGLMRGIRVDRAAILLFDDDDVMRFSAWRGISDMYRSAVEGHNPWPADERDPQPIAITDMADATGLAPDLIETITHEGIRAVVFVPLVFQHRLLGKFMLYFDAPRVLTNEELALAQTIASTIAFAISRVRADHNVRLAKELAEHASQAKSQFLGVMSHELRTPLNAVLGYADLLLMEVRGPLTAGQREQIERIRASAQHQLQLIEELLTYTRLQAGREEANLMPTDLRRVVSDVAEFVRPEAERKGLTLRIELPDHPLEIVTDPAKLRQIILNFAANATKFTASGEVALGAARVLDGFAVRVRDTGPGISADMVEYIFEPFAQVSEGRTRASGGTGLGLAIARRFAELLGAHIDVRTQPGKGATFILRLPPVPPEPSRA